MSEVTERYSAGVVNSFTEQSNMFTFIFSNPRFFYRAFGRKRSCLSSTPKSEYIYASAFGDKLYAVVTKDGFKFTHEDGKTGTKHSNLQVQLYVQSLIDDMLSTKSKLTCVGNNIYLYLVQVSGVGILFKISARGFKYYPAEKAHRVLKQYGCESMLLER